MWVVGWIGCAHRVPEVAEPLVDGFALVDVTLWSGDERPPLADQTVVVAAGKIVAVGPVATLAVPGGLREIDGGDRFVMAGLADMHAHLPDAEPDDTLTTEQALAMHLGRGVTTVRSMRGTAAQLVLRDRIAAGELPGPRLIVGAPVQDLAADAIPARIAEIDAAGYDFVKLMGGIDRAAYAALVESAAAHGLPIAGHVPSEIPLDDVLAAGQCVEHLQSLSTAVRQGADPTVLAAAVHQAGVWNCPTLDYAAVAGGVLPLEAVERRAGLDGIPQADRDRWRTEVQQIAPSADFAAEYQRRQGLLLALANEGAGLLATANHGPFMVPGYGMREELARWEECGITPQQALIAASQGSAARWFGAEDWGSPTVGHDADLLVLEASPLDDLDNLGGVYAVVRAGQWIGPSSGHGSASE